MIQAKGGDGGWEVVINGQPRGWGGEGELERIQNLDADGRIKVMLSDGIAGECIFPTIGLYIWGGLKNPEVGAACCRIYNTWVYDLLEARSPRFRCAGLIPTWDIDAAVKEAEAIAELGLGCAMLPITGTPPPYNDPRWEPLWTVLENAGLPVVMHQALATTWCFFTVVLARQYRICLQRSRWRPPGPRGCWQLQAYSNGIRTCMSLWLKSMPAGSPGRCRR